MPSRWFSPSLASLVVAFYWSGSKARSIGRFFASDSADGETGGERARRSIAGVESLLSKLGGAGAGEGVVSLLAVRRALKMDGVPYWSIVRGRCRS